MVSLVLVVLVLAAEVRAHRCGLDENYESV